MYRHVSKSRSTQRVGSRAQVMHGNAKMTGGGLKKKDLKYNKDGKIVSKKLSRIAKQEKRLQKAGYETQKGVFQLFQKRIGGSDSESEEEENESKAAPQSVSAGLNDNERIRLGINKSLAAPGGAAASQSVSAGLNDNERIRLGINESLAAPAAAMASHVASGAPGGAGAMASPNVNLNELKNRALVINLTTGRNNKKRSAINKLAKDIKNKFHSNKNIKTIKKALDQHKYNIDLAMNSLQEWSCKRCTYNNPSSSNACNICGQPKN